LRAIAVICAIAFHIRADKLAEGFIGVDVYFVISGFLISSLLIDSIKQGQFSFAKFYYRRIRRILPALLLVVTATFAADWELLLPRDLSDLSKMVVSSAFFVPNFRL